MNQKLLSLVGLIGAFLFPFQGHASGLDEWINNKANQPAPQETELVNYERGVIDLNDGLSGLDVNLGF